MWGYRTYKTTLGFICDDRQRDGQTQKERKRWTDGQNQREREEQMNRRTDNKRTDVQKLFWDRKSMIGSWPRFLFIIRIHFFFEIKPNHNLHLSQYNLFGSCHNSFQSIISPLDATFVCRGPSSGKWQNFWFCCCFCHAGRVSTCHVHGSTWRNPPNDRRPLARCEWINGCCSWRCPVIRRHLTVTVSRRSRTCNNTLRACAVGWHYLGDIYLRV